MVILKDGIIISTSAEKMSTLIKDLTENEYDDYVDVLLSHDGDKEN